MLRPIISLILCFSFFSTQSGFAQGVAELNLGQMGNNLAVDKFRPLHLRYFSYDPAADNFQLLLDKGDNQDIKEAELQEKTKVLMEYFQIGLALPNDKFWVNLRPDAQDQIIDPELEKTDLGKVMLESDLQLKKDTANSTSPQTPEGRAYWDKLYQKARELFGNEPANIPTITRPWIVPGEIIVREGESSAYIFKANMKVMLEQDHLKNSAAYNFTDPRMKELNEYSSQLIRELIIPKLTKEVNTSKRYASLRQVFFSLVLARWFKERFGKPVSQLAGKPVNSLTGKPANLSQLVDSGNLVGITSQDPWSKSYYFNEYKKSFEKGEYNLKENLNTPTGQVIRSYVSGGLTFQKKNWQNDSGHYNVRGVNSPLSNWKDWKVLAILVTLPFLVGLPTIVEIPDNIFRRLERIQQEKFSPKEKSAFPYSFPQLPKTVDSTKSGHNAKKKILEIAYSNTLRELKELDEKITFNDFEGSGPHLYKALFSIGSHRYDIETMLNIISLITKELSKDTKGLFAKSILNLPKSKLETEAIILREKSADILKEWLLKTQEEFRRFVERMPKEERDLPEKIVDYYQSVDMILYFFYKSLDPEKQENYHKISIQWSQEIEKHAPASSKDWVEFLSEVMKHLRKNNPSDGSILDEIIKFSIKEYQVFIRELEPSQVPTITQGRNPSTILNPNEIVSSSAVGGIDFRAMNYLVQPMGSFKDLRFMLPALSLIALERIDLDQELAALRNMVKAGLVPSGARVKEYLAAVFQKGRMEEKQDDLLVCLAEIYRLAEEEVLETSPELRESLVIVDTCRFVLLPNNQRAGLN